MNVRTLCLAMLAFGESSGYDIRKRASEGAYRHFCEASFGSIYPALAKLEADGSVSRREETQPGRPARKVYAITEKGRREFRAALSEEADPDVFRSPFLLLALCAEMMEREDLELAIDRQIENLERDLQEIECEVSESTADGARWVERFARHTINASLDFIKQNRGELNRSAGSHVACTGEAQAFVEAAE